MNRDDAAILAAAWRVLGTSGGYLLATGDGRYYVDSPRRGDTAVTMPVFHAIDDAEAACALYAEDVRPELMDPTTLTQKIREVARAVRRRFAMPLMAELCEVRDGAVVPIDALKDEHAAIH